jgi:hypothetical protein
MNLIWPGRVFRELPCQPVPENGPQIEKAFKVNIDILSRIKP